MSARLLAGIVICGCLGKTGKTWIDLSADARHPLLSPSEARCFGSSWEKIGGVKPESIGSQSILFNAINSNGITKACFDRYGEIWTKRIPP